MAVNTDCYLSKELNLVFFIEHATITYFFVQESFVQRGVKAGFHLNECINSARWCMRSRLKCGFPLGYPRTNWLIEKLKWFELFHRLIIPLYVCINLGRIGAFV